ncbi:abi family protein [Limosilactobacillus frumenti DSM 13145]|uniref:Abi family protein n=1 Tax=Limosilactobacillus frumenti DSM 13145 TaxID=1423746 RepID=A0A0R1P4M5_9LACO|nr:abi family protein [Limosilactobacillus frumenti DSM 13145]
MFWEGDILTGTDNSKPFKTLNQQLSILRSRGLDDAHAKAKRSLEQIGYYSLINGYKWMFLARGTNGEIIHPEVYKDDASFDEIKSLYDFDFELRAILYRSLLKYETMLGAEIAYRFSEQYPEEHAYLAMDNFFRDAQHVSSVVGTISSLSSTIKKYSDRRGKNAIKHYVNKHGHVPLWVLVNFLTFGELNYFYANCTEDIQLAIARDFRNMKCTSYNNSHQSAITPGAIRSINQMVNIFRNAVAHGEITYSKIVYRTPHMGEIKSAAGINNIALRSQAGVFELIIAMKAVLPKKNFRRLINDMNNLIENFKDNFSPVNYSTLLQDMHFPSNYRSIL